MAPGTEAASAGHGQPVESLTVRGALSYDGTIALPQDGFAIVELRDTEAPHAVVAEQRIELRGQSLPVQFGLVVNRARLASGRTYAVRGAVKQGANALWTTDPVAVNTASATIIELGMQDMKPARVVGDPSTTLWDQGHRVTLTVRGKTYPECVRVSNSE